MIEQDEVRYFVRGNGHTYGTIYKDETKWIFKGKEAVYDEEVLTEILQTLKKLNKKND